MMKKGFIKSFLVITAIHFSLTLLTLFLSFMAVLEHRGPHGRKLTWVDAVSVVAFRVCAFPTIDLWKLCSTKGIYDQMVFPVLFVNSSLWGAAITLFLRRRNRRNKQAPNQRLEATGETPAPQP